VGAADPAWLHVQHQGLLVAHPAPDPHGLAYKDLRPEDAKANVYAKDLDPKVVDQVWERFLAALDPLHQAGKLGALLFQFPQWFPIGRRNKEYVLECKRRADPVPIWSSSATRPGCPTTTRGDPRFPHLVRGAVRVRGHAAGAHVVDPAGGRGDG
jgi:Uncharacterized conserved protein